MSESKETEQDPVIEDLSPATISGIADRLATSTTFTELISRECELDALWSLCDIALDYSSSSRGGTPETTAATAGERATLEALRKTIGEAISSLGSSKNDEAARLVREAATLASALG